MPTYSIGASRRGCAAGRITPTMRVTSCAPKNISDPVDREEAMATRDTPSPRLAAGTLAALMAATLFMHAAVTGRYGYFRDELYYLASTGHLAWGYVEHPPLSIAILAIVRALLGDSLPALRLVPALAGAATVLLTGLMARRLGGGRFAQGLAALACALTPVFLGTDRVYSMNAIDILIWSLAAWLLLRALDLGRARDWAVLGLGLLHKISVFWLGGGLLVGLLLTPYRRALLAPGPWLCGAIAAAMF